MVNSLQSEQDNCLQSLKEKQTEIDTVKLRLAKATEAEQKAKMSQQELQKVYLQLQDKCFEMDEESTRKRQVEDHCNQLKAELD